MLPIGLSRRTEIPSAKAPSPPVRPILTFGGARNPALSAVPTFRETVGKDKKGTAITTTIAVFAPIRTPKPVIEAM